MFENKMESQTCFVCGDKAGFRCGHCLDRFYCGIKCQETDKQFHIGCGFDLPSLETTTTENKAYRRVLFTTDQMQLVVQFLQPGQEIGTETHEDATQFVRVEKGDGMAMMGKRLVPLQAESAIMVPPGVHHNLWASKNGKGLWIYVLYSPPQHKDGLVQIEK